MEQLIYDASSWNDPKFIRFYICQSPSYNFILEGTNPFGRRMHEMKNYYLKLIRKYNEELC